MNYTKIAHKIRKKIIHISGELSRGLDKTARRFVVESVYGIISSKSVLLTEIGRSLETEIPLKKVEERFCRQIGKPHIWGIIHRNILNKVRNRIKDNTLLIIDISDIRKRYARSMEYLSKVRDGSEKEIGTGYWLCSVIGVEKDTDNLVPLYHNLYSQASPDFKSENDEIMKAVSMISDESEGRGIYVIDRGGDRERLYREFLKRKLRFIIRLTAKRNVIYRGILVNVLELSRGYTCRYKDVIVKIEKGVEKYYEIEYGSLKVKLPFSDQSLWLIVLKGIGDDPIMILTTENVGSSRRKIEGIVESYLKRWKIEETFRFIKQEYDLENIRLLRYRCLRNMMALILVVYYILAIGLEGSDKLKVMTTMIIKSAKRIFGISKFVFYALGDGLSIIFKRSPGEISIKRDKKMNWQIELNFP
jgi:hypothetical protein